MAVIVLLTLLSWVFWQKLNTSQRSKQSTATSTDSSNNTHSKRYITFYGWYVRLPLRDTSSNFITDSSSFSGNSERGSYGITIEEGTGCLATPAYVATISRVLSTAVITKPTSPWANTREYDDYYGKTWSQYYQQQLVNSKKTGVGYVKGVKELGDYTYVLGHMPSKCAAPDSSTVEGKKINQLTDERAAELNELFNDLEAFAQTQDEARQSI